MKFKKILVNSKENLEFLNSLEKIYMVGYWARYGTKEFPFTGKFENKSGQHFPIVYHYNDYIDMEEVKKDLRDAFMVYGIDGFEYKAPNAVPQPEIKVVCDF